MATEDREDPKDRSPTLLVFKMQIIGVTHILFDPTSSHSVIPLKLLQGTYLSIYINC